MMPVSKDATHISIVVGLLLTKYLIYIIRAVLLSLIWKEAYKCT